MSASTSIIVELDLSIWSGSAFRDVAASKTACPADIFYTPYDKKCTKKCTKKCSVQQSIFEISTTVSW